MGNGDLWRAGEPIQQKLVNLSIAALTVVFKFSYGTTELSISLLTRK